MGAGASSSDTGEGMTLERLIEEANRVLVKATEVISQTVESEIGDLTELQQRAASQVADTYAMIQNKLAELTRHSEKAQACVRRKEAELQGIQLKMKNSMLECYARHNEALDKLRPERAIVHTEATQFKHDAQRMIQNCMMSENRLECFQKGLEEMGKRADALLKKCENLFKREAEIRSKSTKMMLECDKKAIDEANKSFSRVIDEVKQCHQDGVDKT